MENFKSKLHAYSNNDFELVIRLTKHLEHLLKKHFNASGTGLGQCIRSATYCGAPLSRALKTRLWRLNLERNKLIHELEYNRIQDRKSFIRVYEKAVTLLKELEDDDDDDDDDDDVESEVEDNEEDVESEVCNWFTEEDEDDDEEVEKEDSEVESSEEEDDDEESEQENSYEEREENDDDSQEDDEEEEDYY